MRLKDQSAANEFMRIVMSANGNVEVRERHGKFLDMKSMKSRYMVVSKLLNDHDNDLELYCENREDEARFMEMFKNGKLIP